MRLSLGQALLHNNLRQVVHTFVPLSPSRISGCRCKIWDSNGMLWKRCGLLSITLSVSSHCRLKTKNWDERRTLMSCERAMLTCVLSYLLSRWELTISKREIEAENWWEIMKYYRDCLSVADHPRTGLMDTHFCSLDLDPMTLILHHDADIRKKYLHTEEVAQLRVGLLWVQISDRRGRRPPNHCWCQNTRLIALSCGVEIFAVYCLVLSQSTLVTDGQTDGRTDRIMTPKTALA